MKTKICFILPQGIGDFVLFSKVLLKINEAGFDFGLVLKGEREAAFAKLIFPTLTQVFSINGTGRSRLESAIKLLGWLYSRRFDIVISGFGVHSLYFAFLALLSFTPVRVGWGGFGSILNSSNIKPRGLHKTIEFAQILNLLEIECDERDLHFSHKVKFPLHKRVILAPGSGVLERHKRWPAEYFSVLARKIVNELNCEVLLVGSRDECALCEEIKTLSRCESVRNACGRTSPQGLLEVLNNADIVISNCNGISHLASYCGTRVLGIYGPTNPAVTGPLGSILIPVSSGLSCAPCYGRDYIYGCGKPTCMSSIEVDLVFSLVKQYFFELNADAVNSRRA